MVSEKKRAWHAGKSYWNGIKDRNSKKSKSGEKKTKNYYS